MIEPTLPKILAVVGPTASGKTALGAFLCAELGGEIVSADAKQVYKGMDIGTAKELDLPVPQHLLDIKEPGQTITVAEYQGLAYEVIDGLLAKDILPVLVGGSGLYAESVLEGYEFAGKGAKQKSPRYSSLKLGIDIDRELLKGRVKERVARWLHEGLLDEIDSLLASGISREWLESCGMEYKYFTQYRLGEISLEEATELTATSTNQFIKRQYTWWRRHDDVRWVRDKEEALVLARDFLHR
jgi:tRNA dimethylallyltransferase